MRQEQPEYPALWAALTVFGFYSLCHGKPLRKFTVQQRDFEKIILAAEKRLQKVKGRSRETNQLVYWQVRVAEPLLMDRNGMKVKEESEA